MAFAKPQPALPMATALIHAAKEGRWDKIGLVRRAEILPMHFVSLITLITEEAIDIAATRVDWMIRFTPAPITINFVIITVAPAHFIPLWIQCGKAVVS